MTETVIYPTVTVPTASTGKITVTTASSPSYTSGAIIS